MQTMTVNDILQNISVLPPEDQYFIAEILSKRISDLKRRQIAARTDEAEENYKTGKISSGSVADLMKEINDD